MMLSQRCQYALRAVFELAKQAGNGPIKIHDIAKAQAIPPRFLEIILNQMKQAGIVDSRRGKEGGYFLVKSASETTVGDVIRLIQGPICIVDCRAGGADSDCPLCGDCVFWPLWEEAREALLRVYDKKTFSDLVAEDSQRMRNKAPIYTI